MSHEHLRSCRRSGDDYPLTDVPSDSPSDSDDPATALVVHPLTSSQVPHPEHPNHENNTGKQPRSITSIETLNLFKLENLETPPRIRWSEHISCAAEEYHVQELLKSHGIIVFHQQHGGALHLEVQNKLMKKILAAVFVSYPDFHAELLSEDGPWEFGKPFLMFAHKWDALCEYKVDELHGESDDAAASDELAALAALLATIEVVIKPTLDAISRIRDTGLVEWSSIPSIFPPHHLALLNPKGTNIAARIQSGATLCHESSGIPGDECWSISLEFVDWDGYSCGLMTESVKIPWYPGHKRVLDLPTYALSFVVAKNELKATLTARGRKWEALIGVHHKYFSGKLLPSRTGVEIESSGRIMIDVKEYKYREELPREQLIEKFDAPVPGGLEVDQRALTDEQCLMASGTVFGFELQSKNWCAFPVEGISDIVFNPIVFEKLVLPATEKKLAWAFVKSKQMLSKVSTDGFDDFVVDKGRGLIMLLCGPPGVGKTLTAEAIAEKARVPLYMMSAGEIGSTPKTVDAVLNRTLGLCKKWGAMLLMDEADVFLGKRFGDGGGSLKQNELVSIFLRRLEYYQGTLFLTTNQIHNIDDAFQSRIDLILPYKDLTSEARLQVWKNFVDKAGKHRFELSEGDMYQLAAYDLNGREIKNLVKISMLLAAGNLDDDGGDDALVAAANQNKAEDVTVSMELLDSLACMRVEVQKLMAKGSRVVFEETAP